MTLMVKLSRPTTARGQDVIAAALMARPALAGFLIKSALMPYIGLTGLSKLSSRGEEKLLIADLRLEDTPGDLGGLQSLSGLVSGVTVSIRLAVSRDWPFVAEALRAARIAPVLSFTWYELEQEGLTADRVASVARSSGINYVMLVRPEPSLVKDLLAMAPQLSVILDGIELGSGICIGASYEVIGQEVLDAEDPLRSVRVTIYGQKRSAEDCEAGRQPLRAFQT